VTHLILPTLDYLNSPFDSYEDEQLMKVIQEMKHLQVLNVHCHHSLQPYFNLGLKLKELTIRIEFFREIFSEKNNQVFENWMTNSFIPPNLNIIVLNRTMTPVLELIKFLMDAWPRWNSQIPAGHTACLKLYKSCKVPLNLFQNAPLFQLQYGRPVTLPFVHASNVGVTDEWLLLTDHDDGSKVVCKAKLWIYPSNSMYHIILNCELDELDCHVSNLTELDLSECYLDFKQLIVNCPQLQRLNLWKNECLELEDLQVIATCHNLQGLNLGGLYIPDSKFCVKVWEILSTMKLIHLTVDTSFIRSGSRFKTDNAAKKKLVTLFKQFTTLQALEFSSSYSYADCYELLFTFPSLEYLRLNSSIQPNCVQDILTTCKKLKHFYCSCPVQLLQLLPVFNNLQQLCISSERTHLSDNFMDTVSAHGGLIHVAFFVCSVSNEGITTLIKNSPNLLTFGLHEKTRCKRNCFESLSASLGTKFAHRKLFTSGSFDLVLEPVRENEWLRNTDLLSLFP